MNKSLIIDISGKCNLDCAICYQDLDKSELPKEEILRLVNENSQFDTVEIGGGEPMLHPEITALVRDIRAREKRVHLSTNGTVIPADLLDLEDEIRANTQVQVSLHASNPKLYQQITGRDLFSQVRQNIPRFQERYSTVLTTVVYQDNVDDVPNLVRLSGEMGLPLRVTLVHPVGRGQEVACLTERQVDQLRGYLLQQKLITHNRVDSPLVHANNCAALESAYGLKKESACPADCQAKKYISPRGEVSVCEFLPKSRLTKIGGI